MRTEHLTLQCDEMDLGDEVGKEFVYVQCVMVSQ